MSTYPEPSITHMTAGNPHDSPAGDYEQTYLIGKLRLREAKMLAQGHPTRKWQI